MTDQVSVGIKTQVRRVHLDPPYNLFGKPDMPPRGGLSLLRWLALPCSISTHRDRIVPSRTFFASIIFSMGYLIMVYCGITNRRMASKQLKLFVDSALITRLKAASIRYGKSSANMIAAEIIERYLPFWEELQQAQERVFDEQRERSGIKESGPRHPHKKTFFNR